MTYGKHLLFLMLAIFEIEYVKEIWISGLYNIDSITAHDCNGRGDFSIRPIG